MDAPITDPDNIRVTFVNDLAGFGFLNGNINLTFTTARWTPKNMGQDVVPPDLIVSSRLRLDLKCAQTLRDVLDTLISEHTKPAVSH